MGSGPEEQMVANSEKQVAYDSFVSKAFSFSWFSTCKYSSISHLLIRLSSSFLCYFGPLNADLLECPMVTSG